MYKKLKQRLRDEWNGMITNIFKISSKKSYLICSKHLKYVIKITLLNIKS